MSQAYHQTSILGSIIALLGACAIAEADPAPVFPEQADPAPEVAEPEPVVFDNTILDEELRPALERARDRWVAASCLDIRLDGGGAQWSATDEKLPMPDGRQANGSMDTSVTPAIGLLWRGAPLERTATHELGHRLGIKHVEEHELMNERNLVNRQEGLRYDHIGEGALLALCEVQDCPCFNPEPGPSYDPSLFEPKTCQMIHSDLTTSWEPCP